MHVSVAYHPSPVGALSNPPQTMPPMMASETRSSWCSNGREPRDAGACTLCAAIYPDCLALRPFGARRR